MIGTPLPSPAVTPSPRRGKAILGSTLEGELSNEVRMRERFSKQISLSLPPSLVMLVPPPSSEGGNYNRVADPTFYTLRFALCI